MKNLFKNLSLVNYECPGCAKNNQNRQIANARLYSMWDEQYHIHKFYVKCPCCDLTTPAFPTGKEALVHWDDYWVDTEHEVTKKLFD